MQIKIAIPNQNLWLNRGDIRKQFETLLKTCINSITQSENQFYTEMITEPVRNKGEWSDIDYAVDIFNNSKEILKQKLELARNIKGKYSSSRQNIYHASLDNRNLYYNNNDKNGDEPSIILLYTAITNNNVKIIDFRSLHTLLKKFFIKGVVIFFNKSEVAEFGDLLENNAIFFSDLGSFLNNPMFLHDRVLENIKFNTAEFIEIVNSSLSFPQARKE